MFDGYIICGTPRTGSTLLCRLLASTGSAGDPHSFYRTQDIAEWALEWGVPALGSTSETSFQKAYLEAVLDAGRAGTPIFGLRLMRENVGALSGILDELHPGLRSDRARLEQAFGRLLYIHLSREDKVAQAVSFVKAQQTGLWHVAPDGTEIERVAPARDAQYDFERIRAKVEQMEAFDASWNDWFSAQRITPLRITYEGLSADPAGTLIRVCATLGVALPDAADVRPGVARLADDTNLDWVRRFERDRQRVE